MIDRRDYSDAEDSLELALQHARRAVALTETKKEQKAQEEEKARQKALEAQKAAEKAMAEKARTKPDLTKTQPARQPSAKEATPPPAKTYEVREGDNLWIISNREVVYGDGFLWPLLYQANRDQIKDPRQIYPGQILNIRRDLTTQEMEEARQKAKESDIFPVPTP